jgi:hypothetical protein
VPVSRRSESQDVGNSQSSRIGDRDNYDAAAAAAAAAVRGVGLAPPCVAHPGELHQRALVPAPHTHTHTHTHTHRRPVTSRRILLARSSDWDDLALPPRILHRGWGTWRSNSGDVRGVDEHRGLENTPVRSGHSRQLRRRRLAARRCRRRTCAERVDACGQQHCDVGLAQHVPGAAFLPHCLGRKRRGIILSQKRGRVWMEPPRSLHDALRHVRLAHPRRLMLAAPSVLRPVARSGQREMHGGTQGRSRVATLAKTYSPLTEVAPHSAAEENGGAALTRRS